MTRRGPGRAPHRHPLVPALVGAAVARAALTLLTRVTRRAADRDGVSRWTRHNHRGGEVTLLEGPAWALGALAACAVPGAPARLRTAAAVATAASAGLGAYDDLAGSGDSRGLRGHLGELRRGRVTTGAVKVLGLAGAGTAAAAVALPGRRIDDALVGGAVVAGCANLINLLDLRPGRALKVTVLASLPLAAPAAVPAAASAGVAAAAGGAALAMLPADLRERAMLGDTGANAAGALLGTALIARTGRRGRLAALAVLAALTLASERVSFTRVIESTPGLRQLDALGRLPR